jgi:sugar lactone lactonase YvrE
MFQRPEFLIMSGRRWATTWRLCLAAICCNGLAAVAQAALPEVIHIPGERVVPESLTSTRDGTIYIGSILSKAVFRVKAGSDTAEAWINPGTDGMEAILGVFADDAAHTLWVCSRHPFDAPATGAGGPPSTIFAFDLNSGKTRGKYPLPTPGGSCNDMAVAPNGTLYATDSDSMQVVQLKKDARQFEVWSAAGVFGPKGGILDGISVLHQMVYVNTLNTSKLFVIPIQANETAGPASEVTLDHAIERPDGMRSFGKASVLVVERADGGKLAKISLTGARGALSIVKQGYPDDPVSVTVVGETAYVLEGQFQTLRDPAYKPNPFRATAVTVGKP